MGRNDILRRSVDHFLPLSRAELMMVELQESFSKRWNYKDWNTPGENRVAGNYGAATNVWQAGLCMLLCMYQYVFKDAGSNP